MQADPNRGTVQQTARPDATLVETDVVATGVTGTSVGTTSDLDVTRTEATRAGVASADATLVEVIPVVEETARITKREVETGRVRVHKTVRERDEAVEVLLRQEELEVERVPVGRVVSEAPAPRQEGDTYVLPVLVEELVVEKRLVLKEELRVRRRATERTAHEVVRLRSEEVVVEDLSSSAAAGAGGSPLPASSPTAVAQPRTQKEP